MKDFVNVTDVSFNEVNLEKVGRRIKKLRIENHLTVEQFAEILCVSENAVYKWQRGDSAPDIMNFGFMSSRFEVSLDYLILGRGDGDEPSPLPVYWNQTNIIRDSRATSEKMSTGHFLPLPAMMLLRNITSCSVAFLFEPLQLRKKKIPKGIFFSELEGFEPSCPGGLTHFECAPL